MARRLFTSESVSEGHPDKMADQISDAILDEALRLAGDDAGKVRCACETLVKGDLLVIAGELCLADPGKVPDYESIARQVAKDIGYGDPALGFDPDNCRFVNCITEQSADFAGSVGTDKVEGAGDQGMMFGYATDETQELMPLAVTLAHDLVRRQAQLRREGHGWLGPDAKSQVTVRYEEEVPLEVTDVVLSTQHTEEIDGKPYPEVLEELVREMIIEPVLQGIDHSNCRYIINPSGKFIKGGPEADAGLTGRKIIVDTYGGAAPHGGGAFSGKDPSKVDRSAAYAARLVAKSVVAAGLASRALVQVSYAIGHPKPVSVMVETFGTSSVSDEDIAVMLMDGELIDLEPQGIIDKLDLFRPIYRQTAAYGHFGRKDLEPPLPWEETGNTTPKLRERFFESNRAMR